MRITKVFRQLLAVTSMVIRSVTFEGEALLLEVAPRWRAPRCGECGQQAPGYDRKGPRRWRSLSFGSFRVYLQYALRRVSCPRCQGVRSELVPWAARDSWFTRDFEEMVAYLVQVTNKTEVAKLMGVAWDSVDNAVPRVVHERLDPSRLDGLRRIGIDEFSYRKRHRYITVVVDHDRRRIVWAREGRSAETLGAFFDELGQERLALLELATIDMAGGYIKALRERAPHVQIVFDRFHVQRLASDAIDEVRRAQARELKGTEEGKSLKKSRFALLRNKFNLTRRDKQKLRDIQANNRSLYRAYLLKEALVAVFEETDPRRAETALDEWLAWASRSRLVPFVRVARTIRRHRAGILAYIGLRLTNALAEGTNTVLRMIARRAYGFHSSSALIAMAYLVAGGIALHPPLP